MFKKAAPLVYNSTAPTTSASAAAVPTTITAAPTGTKWPVAPGTVRSVQWRVLLNKKPLVGCESVEIHATNHRKASTFHARFAWGADPEAVATWLDMDPPLLTEIQVSLVEPGKPADWKVVFVGEASDINFDPVTGGLEVSGRDLAGRLMEANTRESFRNKTGSEIAQIIAARYGLTADVDATTQLAGPLYQLEHDKMTGDNFNRTTSCWDLLAFMAQHDDRDLWVDGTVLHYKKSVAIADAKAIDLPWKARGTAAAYAHSPITDLKLHRHANVAKGIKVVVKTWDSKGKKPQRIEYPPGAKADAQEYVFVKAGMSPQQALVFAQSMYKDVVAHERIAELIMPGSLDVTPRSVIAISGLPGKTYNTRYAVDELTSVFIKDGAFRQNMSLKNHKVQSQASVG